MLWGPRVRWQRCSIWPAKHTAANLPFLTLFRSVSCRLFSGDCTNTSFYSLFSFRFSGIFTIPEVAESSSSSSSSVGGERENINSELWHACAGPLVMLPQVGSLVVYFPQGHSEQVAASMQKNVDAQIPNYSNLPSKLICLLHSVTLHADAETDKVYAQMTLQPVSSYDNEALLASDFAFKSNKPQAEFFSKTLTARDTSSHGGFSGPHHAAEKFFPSLVRKFLLSKVFTVLLSAFHLYIDSPVSQFRIFQCNLLLKNWSLETCMNILGHFAISSEVYLICLVEVSYCSPEKAGLLGGQPKRHLLTTGWSLFIGEKRLFVGDSALFIRDGKQQLLLGIRRANRQPTNLLSSVLSSDSMHIGILEAAAHAAANHSPFTVFYNPSLVDQIYGYNYSVSDLDPVRWKNSQLCNLQVGWDESTAGEMRNRVSIWEIESAAAPFFIFPSPFFRSKRQRQLGMPGIPTLGWTGAPLRPACLHHKYDTSRVNTRY
ncbi:hypothetical protein HHK36_026177 [Tetracentron sinense]|uniref:Auxin response factor domain-containing protein n=1 Tax=Tetracentron sinense TaxID=13715 RepID=A0A834YNY6_TETSI|nr:hypothetical protein HHK36_026177 [Tetracentron sinense]